jgi:AcrR family transcriptional regulator
MTPKIKSSELVRTKHAQICRAAEELFASKGYHKTSIRDIAKASGISIGSLYDYISNKEDILYLLAQEFFDILSSEVRKVREGNYDVLQEMEATIETTTRVIDRFQEYTLFTYRDSKYLKKKHLAWLLEQDAFVSRTFTEIIQRGIDEGVFETQEPEIVANLVMIMTHAWALKRYNLKKHPFYFFEKILLKLIFEGLLKKKKDDDGLES